MNLIRCLYYFINNVIINIYIYLKHFLCYNMILLCLYITFTYTYINLLLIFH